MGAGASSKTSELTDEEKARIAELKALAPELQAKLAVEAMRSVLSASAAYAVERGSTEECWAEPLLKIPVPDQGRFTKVQEAVGKIPVVGSKLAAKIGEVTASITRAMTDCAMAVCKDPSTLQAYQEAVATLSDSEDVVALCEGAEAFTAFFVQATGEKLAVELKTIVQGVLKTHSVTKVWGTAIESFNAATKVLPKGFVATVSLDLADFVVVQTLATLHILIREREAAIRADPGEDCDEAVKKIFGKGQRRAAELICPLVLVQKGDPRSFYVSEQCAADLQTQPTPIVTQQGLHVVMLSETPNVAGPWSSISLGVGQPAPQSVPPKFYRKDKFIACEVGGATKVMDIAASRIAQGSRLNIIHNTADDAMTWREDGSRDFVINEDRTISPASTSKLVLGIKIFDDDKNSNNEATA